MKKIIIILFVLTFFIITKKEEVIIPEESIRFRIIANSNSLEDQLKKNIIKEELKKEIIPSILKSNSINDTRINIKNNISKIEEYLDSKDIEYNINYGNNYFPEKLYKGVKYNEGKYESLVITLGQGLGDNFWCVLYPPLCLVEENNNQKDITYKSYIKEIINKN